jgi:hypothetical protein
MARTAVAGSFMDKVGGAFWNKWEIEIRATADTASAVASSLGVTDAPLNLCSRAAGSECGTGVLGIGGCLSFGLWPEDCLDDHHRNVHKNVNWMKDDLSPKLNTYHLLLMLTGANTCGKNILGNHSETFYGTSIYKGKYALASTGYYGGNLWLPERVAQHELSHLFGCEEPGIWIGPGAYDFYECSATWCLMYPNSLVLQNNDWSNPNVWCYNCQQYFNRNQH